MDQAKSSSIRMLFSNRGGAEILSKFRLPPVLWEPFKVLLRLPVFLAIWKPIGMAEMIVHCGTRSVVLIGKWL
jgi:hypothetical protein